MENPTTLDGFIEAIRLERDRGISFIPLVGAGLSAPSGNPIVTELEHYLIRCICRALGIDHPKAWNPSTGIGTVNLQGYYRWLPGRDDWPPYGDPQIYARDTENWKQRLSDFFVELARRSEAAKLRADSQGSTRDPSPRGGGQPNEADPDDGFAENYDELKIVQEAVGASAEWRSALLFLSRLVVLDGVGKSRFTPLRLGPPNRDIVDTFVLTVMMGRPPTLGHRMLAMLAGPLRISLALTTNFDDLLEHAFAESNNPCTVFDVHIDSGLPSFRDLAGLNAIVKLHGGRYGMRADYSLDTPPSEADLRHFVSYLAGCPIDDEKWSSLRHRQASRKDDDAHPSRNRLPAQRHLLVVGVSAKDARINRMIRAAASVLDNMQVFWICYFEWEVTPARNLLSDLGVKTHYVLMDRFPGLLLLHAYQELAGSLPASHAVFPAAHRVPVPPVWRRSNPARKSAEDNKPLQDLHDLVTRCSKIVPTHGADGQLHLPNTRCIIVHGPRETTAGGMSIGAEVFDRQLDLGHQAVWIDLDEIGSVNDLFESLIHTVARKAGINDWMPVLLRVRRGDVSPRLAPGVADAQIHELARMTNSPNRKWIIFMNARSGTGENLRPAGQNIQNNGWLDDVELKPDLARLPDDDMSATGTLFVELLKRIGGEECPNVSVVLLCFDGRFLDKCVPRLKPFPFRLELKPGKTPLEKSVDAALSWASEYPNEREARTRFLWALCLANRARFLAMLWQWPFHQTISAPLDHLDHRKSQTSGFLTQLESKRVIRRKNGGFVWMLCRVRDQLRQRLPAEWARLKSHSNLTAADIHHGLAEWYHRLFRTTEDAGASFEIVYHRCRQTKELLDIVQKVLEKSPNDKAVFRDITMRIRDALGDALLALARGRDSMLSLGFSKGLCRRLHHLRSSLLTELTDSLDEVRKVITAAIRPQFRKLETTLTEGVANLLDQSYALNRAIAIEVGENTVAVRRQLQLRREQYLRRLAASLGSRGRQSPRITEFPDLDTILRARRANSQSSQIGGYLKEILRWHKELGEPLEDWMQSTNELATLGIAIRSYGYTRAQLARIFEQHRFPTKELSGDTSINQLEMEFRDWLGRFEVEDPHRNRGVLQQMLISLRRHQQLVLAEEMAKITWCERYSRSGGDGTKEPDKWNYHSAARSYEMAIRIIRWLVGTRDPRSTSENSLGNAEIDLDRVSHRLVVHHALTLAYQQDFTQAHARLNDAEAALNRAGVAPHSLDRGITELMRTEVLTQQVLYTDRPSFNYNTFGLLRRDILQQLSREDLLKDGIHLVLQSQLRLMNASGRAVRKSVMPDDEVKTLQIAKSCNNDAWQACHRAERSLSRFRKNVWWTTWYFELQMKLAELEIFVALKYVADHDGVDTSPQPLPHLGPESAAYAVPTLIERLLDNAERMVRFDLFRIARVVESFANSLNAGLLWTLRLPTGQMQDFMNLRLELLCKRLREARSSLETRLDHRLEADEIWDSTRLDENVRNYIMFVLDHCDRVCQCVSVAPYVKVSGLGGGEGTES